jgi:hypothetical protein
VTRKTTALTAVVAAIALVTCGLTFASSAATGSKSHTVHYTAKTVSVERLDRLDAVTNVKLTRRHLARGGQVKGAAVFTCHRKTATQNYEHCRGALALKQGMMYVNAKLPFSTFRLHGVITGGSGVYKGATGTLSAVIGDTNHNSIMTVTYKL